MVAQDEAPRCHSGDVGELPRDDDGMAEREEVHADEDRKGRAEVEQRSGLDEGVGAEADEEADVVADHHVVDTPVRGPCQRGSALARVAAMGGDAHA